MEKTFEAATDFCVLIPCFNNTAGLVDSINSIEYDPARYQIIIVDDGNVSPINAVNLSQRVRGDLRIHIIRLDDNSGITKALNTGLEFIQANFSTPFIARLDCGDICHPDRFHKQVEFLEAHPTIQLLGTWCYFKNYSSGNMYAYTTPTTHEPIKRSMHLRNVFIHPTVMWRNITKDIKYPEHYPHAEDYGLFYDMVQHGKSAVIGEFLVTCEINEKGISIQHRRAQLISRLRVVMDYGKNKPLVFFSAVKLLLLFVTPYRFVYMIKKRLAKPGKRLASQINIDGQIV